MRVPQQTQNVPEWARRAVFYQIYPLGFLNAPRKNSGRMAAVSRMAELRNYFDHIQNLGVSALCLGPLFESHSHGYDTIDYFSIDRRLGDVNLFRKLVDELHERGLRVIIDGVFHHTGRGFFAFQDICQHGRKSRYKAWYHINWGANSSYNDGFAYDGWEGSEELPLLNLDHPDVREYFAQVAGMWLEDIGVDGWRLDAAHKISPAFWWDFRHVCKETRPDCFLVGEMLGGDYRAWVAPDLLDSGTDYQLFKALTGSLNDQNFWELKAVLERAQHPEWGLYRDLHMLNFLSSPDVSRVASHFANKNHRSAALVLLLTLPGIPCLYYADEIGMTGQINGHDGNFEVRQAMPPLDESLSDEARRLYSKVGSLVDLRKSHPALMYGDISVLETNNQLFCFIREYGREIAIIAINAGDQPTALEITVEADRIPTGAVLRDALNDEQPMSQVAEGKLAINVPPGWGRVLIANH